MMGHNHAVARQRLLLCVEASGQDYSGRIHRLASQKQDGTLTVAPNGAAKADAELFDGLIVHVLKKLTGP